MSPPFSVPFICLYFLTLLPRFLFIFQFSRRVMPPLFGKWLDCVPGNRDGALPNVKLK
ncbi:AzlD domain-containing protein [Aeromonas jandaei]|uniref:AzlD domain-containing protein n=1 Tax=Aeromonas jandaei TaxID=650 RepID=UPI003556A15C